MKTDRTIPVLPNVFPYNEMLFRGILKLGGLGVKTRSWSWSHRGLTLLYTSSHRFHRVPAEAYRLDRADFPRGAIVGVGNLVDVRELTEKEKRTLLFQFNNVTSRTLTTRGLPDDRIEPFDIGFFFEGLTRFDEPIPFTPPKGAVSVFQAPISLVNKALRKAGVSPTRALPKAA